MAGRVVGTIPSRRRRSSASISSLPLVSRCASLSAFTAWKAADSTGGRGGTSTGTAVGMSRNCDSRRRAVAVMGVAAEQYMAVMRRKAIGGGHWVILSVLGQFQSSAMAAGITNHVWTLRDMLFAADQLLVAA